MKKIALILIITALSACASVAPPRVDGTPAPGSKFSKLQLGMTQNQVDGLIGKSMDCTISNDQESYSMVTTCSYKNEGILVYRFLSGSRLYRITVDTTAGEYQAVKN